MSASDGERSPKRQRLESYSPASPPLNPDTKAFIPPDTPPPSVRMSPSWQAQSSQNHHHGSSSTFPTPPSTSGFYGHAAGRGAGSDAGGDSGRQTPVTDAGGEVRKDSDGDMEMADRQDGGDGDAEHRRTNHERQRNADAASSSSLSVLQPLYKLSTTPIPQVRPHPSLDLIQLYSLQRIQASVARRDPRTGEKINKLRKSYENKVKALGLEGRNKAIQNSNELQGLLDPGWNFEHEPGVTYWQAKVRDSNMQLGNKNAEDEIFSKLSAAFDLHPGRLPPKEHKEYQSMLGLDDAAAGVKPGMNKAPNGPVSATAKTAPAAQIRNSAPASPGNMAGRPDRANKKRRYDDSSFVGYQEGYEDDGYSTGGMDDTGRRGSNAKRQKRKDFPTTSTTAQQSARNSPSTFSNGTQNGMVGVRSS